MGDSSLPKTLPVPMIITEDTSSGIFNNNRTGGGPSNAGEAESTSETPTTPVVLPKRRCIPEKVRKCFCGIIMVLGVAASWVGMTQFAKNTYQENRFTAPFFFVWFITGWLIVFFPIFLGIKVLLGTKLTILQAICKDSLRVYGDQNLTVKTFFTRCGLFCVFWVATNYMYFCALSLVPASDVTTLFSSNSAFIYLLSWVALHEKFVSIKILALIFSITGIILITYADTSFRGPSLLGVVLSVGAAATSAVHKVLLKKLVKNLGYGQVSVFLTLLGIFNTFLIWPVMVTLRYANAEFFIWTDLPWRSLCISALLYSAYIFQVNYGVTLTYPVFTSMGLVLAVPSNMVADSILWKVQYGDMKIWAVVLITLSGSFILLPEDWYEHFLKLIRWQKETPVQRQENPRSLLRGSNAGTSVKEIKRGR